MEPLDHDTSLRGHHGRPCAVHGWGPCFNPIAPAVGSLSQGHEGEDEGEEDEEESRQISVMPRLLQQPLTHWTARKTIFPRGRPHGPLAPRTTTPLASLSSSLTAPPASVPPTSEVVPSGSGTLLDLKSPCDNCIIRRLARFASPTGKGCVTRSWGSMDRPMR
jgi:hypothetical protein